MTQALSIGEICPRVRRAMLRNTSPAIIPLIFSFIVDTIPLHMSDSSSIVHLFASIVIIGAFDKVTKPSQQGFSKVAFVQRQSLCIILFCSFCALCLPFGKAQGAETAKNLPGRRRRRCSQETHIAPVPRATQERRE